MATLAQIDAKINAAVAANEAGDYAEAEKQLASAQMLIAGTPNSSHDGSSLQFSGQRIADLLTTIRAAKTRAQLASTSGGIRQTKVIYRRTSWE